MLAPSVVDAAVAIEIVTVEQLGETWFLATEGDASGRFEFGPGTPPSGTGSFELTTESRDARVLLTTDQYDGVELADLQEISYNTHRSSGKRPLVASLVLGVDTDADGAPDRVFVYNPATDAGPGAIDSDTWQRWDTIRSGAGQWWVLDAALGSECSPTNPCTWTELLAMFPGATIQDSADPSTPGSLGFAVALAAATTNVDELVVTFLPPPPDPDGGPIFPGNQIIHDFEATDADGDGVPDGTDNCATPNPDQADFDRDGLGDGCDPEQGPPVDKEQCKHGGWQRFDNPTFDSQSECGKATKDKTPKPK